MCVHTPAPVHVCMNIWEGWIAWGHCDRGREECEPEGLERGKAGRWGVTKVLAPGSENSR